MSFFAELHRRNVFRMIVAYLVAAWVLMQILELAVGVFGAPDWVLKIIMTFLAVGIIPVVMFSWVYELTPEGIKLESEISPEESITAHTAKKLDIAVIVLIIAAMVMLAMDRMVPEEATPTTPPRVIDPPLAEPPPPAVDLSVAVLPFVNMSADAENEFFADGISEEILNLLAGVNDLEVASRTSSFAYKGSSESVPEIAGGLGVRYILEGSVRKAGPQVRITAQLIDAQTDRHLWSDTFDRTLEDIFAVQDEIAAAIGEALEVQLLGAAGEAVLSETIDPAQYEAFLEARFLMRRRSPDSIERAIGKLEPLVEAEPEFARGLAFLAEAYVLSYVAVDSEIYARRQQRAGELAERALALDPDLAAAFQIIGWRAGSAGDRLTMYNSYQRAIELDPTEPRPHHWLALAYCGAGYLDRCMASINEAIRLEPGNANAVGWRSTVHSATGDLDAAIADALKQVELGNPIGHVQAGIYHLLAARMEEALEQFELGEANGFRDGTIVLNLVRTSQTDPGGVAGFLDALPRGKFDEYTVQRIVLALGWWKEFLEFSVEVDTTIPTMIWRKDSADLRATREFMDFMERRGVPALWEEIGTPADCRKQGDGFVCGLGGAP